MKKIILVTFLASILLSACGGKEKTNKQNAAFLPAIEITIADEIKDDAELVDLVKSSEKSINEFSNNIEQLMLDGEDLLRKSQKEDEASMMDKLKAGKLMLTFASHSTEMITTMQKFDSYVQEKQTQGTVNDAQLKALEQVGESFKNRMNEINKKYENYLD